MAKYLLVAHQTADSPELVERVREIVARDPASEFVLIVPATPPSRLLVWEEGETLDIARRRADAAAARLREAGVRLTAARVGDGSPFNAIADELGQSSDYDTIVISTLPPGLSRWLGMDLPGRVAREFSIKVIQVEAQPNLSGVARPVTGS